MKNILLILLVTLAACDSSEQEHIDEYKPTSVIDIKAPQYYYRFHYSVNSFQEYLRDFYLTDDNIVYLYDGTRKFDQSSHYAVLDMSVGKRDLMQCADAVMKLRMLYLKSQHDDIVFYDNYKYPYKISPPYVGFEEYMNRVFGMCGSMSLSNQLHHKDIKNIEPGDVFIKGGFPGHAEIVMDVVETQEGHKMFLLAQGYMPAQSMHIVKNLNTTGSPWFNSSDSIIYTSGYTFTKDQLMTW